MLIKNDTHIHTMTPIYTHNEAHNNMNSCSYKMTHTYTITHTNNYTSDDIETNSCAYKMTHKITHNDIHPHNDSNNTTHNHTQ